jgi:hypothetical protein
MKRTSVVEIRHVSRLAATLIVAASAVVVLMAVAEPQRAAASTFCFHNGPIKICRTPGTNRDKICVTTYLNGFSFTKCHYEAHSSPAKPTSHHASYYLTRSQAEADTRDRLWHHDGYTYVGASCSLPDGSQPRTGYVYHTWACAFSASVTASKVADCSGDYLVSGSDTAGTFYTTLQDSHGPCPLGT